MHIKKNNSLNQKKRKEKDFFFFAGFDVFVVFAEYLNIISFALLLYTV